MYVETDFLIALIKDDDWFQERAEQALEDHDVVTSPTSYLELLIVKERDEFENVRLFSNLLDIVPVGDEAEHQIVLKAVDYYDDGMTPFDSFHAAIAETRGLSILSSDKAYEKVDSQRVPLEPQKDE